MSRIRDRFPEGRPLGIGLELQNEIVPLHFQVVHRRTLEMDRHLGDHPVLESLAADGCVDRFNLRAVDGSHA